MKELALYLAKSLAGRPDQVSIDAEQEGDVVQLTLRVAEEDKGKVIGKQGKVIKAIRSVVGIAAAKADRKVELDLE